MELGQLLHNFYQPGLTPVILHYPVTDMADRADGEYYFKRRIEIPESLDCACQ